MVKQKGLNIDMIELPFHNCRYWCCNHSDESDSYEDKGPHKPWEGILRISKRPGGEHLGLHRFSREFGLVVEIDPNATATVYPKDLFKTQAEAEQYYKEECYRYGNYLLGEASQFFREAMFFGLAVKNQP